MPIIILSVISQAVNVKMHVFITMVGMAMWPDSRMTLSMGILPLAIVMEYRLPCGLTDQKVVGVLDTINFGLITTRTIAPCVKKIETIGIISQEMIWTVSVSEKNLF